MKPEEALVGTILSVVLALLTYMAGSTFAKSGAGTAEVALLCIAIVLGGLAFGGVVKLIPKSVMFAALALCIGAFAILGLLHFRLVPVCGDNVCSAGECESCAKDCSAAQCADGRCDAARERCDNSLDCACTTGLTCAPTRTGVTDPMGCAKISCGDNFCDSGENAQNCCEDCGCQTGFICAARKCIFQRPKITVNPYVAVESISVTSLAGNPMLTNSTGAPRPLAALRIQSTGYAKDMNVTFTIPGVVSDTVRVGFLQGGDEVPVAWYPSADPRLLAVTSDRKTNISVNISYFDSQGDRHSARLSMPITLRGRGTLDKQGHIILFVTKDVKPRASTPIGIWDEVRSNITLEAPPSPNSVSANRIRFPYETQNERKGTPRDVALLLASLYENAGLQPSLVEGVDGSIYVRVRNNGRSVMLDTTRLNGTFEDAISTRPGAALYELQKIRAERNYTRIALNRSYLPNADVSATTKLEQDCVASGIRAVATHRIVNNGLLPAAVCATSTIGAGKEVLDESRACYDIAPGGSVEFRHGWRDPSCAKVTASVAVEPRNPI